VAPAAATVAGLAARRAEPVICAIDDDGLARDVLVTAAALADRLNARLTVVHSAHADSFITGEAHRTAIERGDELVDRLTAGYRVDERVVEVGDPGRLIAALATEGASMVVLGTRRRAALRAAILGSVSHAVIAQAPCPVVTVSEFASQTIQATFAERGESHAVRRDRAESLDWLQRPLA
jgi:nucleotide-binding universal stress UspA family protein